MKNIFFVVSFTIIAICVMNTAKALVRAVQQVEQTQMEYANRLDAMLDKVEE